MGIGDDVMCSGQARALWRRTGRRVRIVDSVGQPRWDPIWEGLSWIVRPGEAPADVVELVNDKLTRPYIAYPFTMDGGCRYSGWRARDEPGAIALTRDELRTAKTVAKRLGPYVVLEPHVHLPSNQNKQWGWSKWQALAEALRATGWHPVQLGPAGVRQLDGVPWIETPSFRAAVAMIWYATAAILPEGGLHHAAGVLEVPAVVLFGGQVDPEATGYPCHELVVDTGPESPCGRWLPCDHCAAIWTALEPRRVLAHVKPAIAKGLTWTERIRLELTLERVS